MMNHAARCGYLDVAQVLYDAGASFYTSFSTNATSNSNINCTTTATITLSNDNNNSTNSSSTLPPPAVASSFPASSTPSLLPAATVLENLTSCTLSELGLPDEEALLLAAEENDARQVALLARLGTDLGCRDAWGRSVLSRAALYVHRPSV